MMMIVTMPPCPAHPFLMSACSVDIPLVTPIFPLAGPSPCPLSTGDPPGLALIYDPSNQLALVHRRSRCPGSHHRHRKRCRHAQRQHNLRHVSA